MDSTRIPLLSNAPFPSYSINGTNLQQNIDTSTNTVFEDIKNWLKQENMPRQLNCLTPDGGIKILIHRPKDNISILQNNVIFLKADNSDHLTTDYLKYQVFWLDQALKQEKGTPKKRVNLNKFKPYFSANSLKFPEKDKYQICCRLTSLFPYAQSLNLNEEICEQIDKEWPRIVKQQQQIENIYTSLTPILAHQSQHDGQIPIDVQDVYKSSEFEKVLNHIDRFMQENETPRQLSCYTPIATFGFKILVQKNTDQLPAIKRTMIHWNVEDWKSQDQDITPYTEYSADYIDEKYPSLSKQKFKIHQLKDFNPNFSEKNLGVYKASCRLHSIFPSEQRFVLNQLIKEKIFTNMNWNEHICLSIKDVKIHVRQFMKTNKMPRKLICFSTQNNCGFTILVHKKTDDLDKVNKITTKKLKLIDSGWDSEIEKRMICLWNEKNISNEKTVSKHDVKVVIKNNQQFHPYLDQEIFNYPFFYNVCCRISSTFSAEKNKELWKEIEGEAFDTFYTI